jgi:hypothetical protein
MSLCAIGTPASAGALPAARSASALRAWASVTSSFDVDEGAERFVGLHAAEKCLRGFDGRDLAFGQGLGQGDHAHLVQFAAHFDHLGHEEKAGFDGRGALLVGFAVVGFAHDVVAQAQRDVLDRGHRMGQGLDARRIDRTHTFD